MHNFHFGSWSNFLGERGKLCIRDQLQAATITSCNLCQSCESRFLVCKFVVVSS